VTHPTGAVTHVQRFGSSLNLNVHLHVMLLDGVFVRDAVATSSSVVFGRARLDLPRLVAGVSVHPVLCRVQP
jgi:hypothetical protein